MTIRVPKTAYGGPDDDPVDTGKRSWRSRPSAIAPILGDVVIVGLVVTGIFLAVRKFYYSNDPEERDADPATDSSGTTATDGTGGGTTTGGTGGGADESTTADSTAADTPSGGPSAGRTVLIVLCVLLLLGAALFWFKKRRGMHKGPIDDGIREAIRSAASGAASVATEAVSVATEAAAAQEKKLIETKKKEYLEDNITIDLLKEDANNEALKSKLLQKMVEEEEDGENKEKLKEVVDLINVFRNRPKYDTIIKRFDNEDGKYALYISKEELFHNFLDNMKTYDKIRKSLDRDAYTLDNGMNALAFSSYINNALWAYEDLEAFKDGRETNMQLEKIEDKYNESDFNEGIYNAAVWIIEELKIKQPEEWKSVLPKLEEIRIKIEEQKNKDEDEEEEE
jgi:hypothetical protein